MSPPIITLQSIPDEGMELTLSLEPVWLRGALEDTGYGPVTGEVSRARVRLDRSGRDVIFTGEFSLRLSAECVACLAPMLVRVSSDFALTLEPRPKGPTKAHEEVELSAQDVDIEYYDDEQIDVGHWLRDVILVEAPVHPRHEGACPEPLIAPLPPTEQASREIDPRLLPLMKLSKKE